ncbi:hypothetical protein PTSG_06976 [Salpingoeca rosetta]|uniref:Uncharacterized protein n=1 Tax=Salpingoeca rosetta (strain ATCC 50818 / BSB-021) TaxID=946362 RepID=F2UFC6_SALR5|nr:uncharacterized protein PTSG_06976 [Salpingoeca rosetta]EGD75326.1 hypothetical protein PTSG_06976 [Salpingoeca rosetta]|eukprot:XP_004992379.1 hypothetical protein PTSG_06976 [Salpingoeca rosetta]
MSSGDDDSVSMESSSSEGTTTASTTTSATTTATATGAHDSDGTTSLDPARDHRLSVSSIRFSDNDDDSDGADDDDDDGRDAGDDGDHAHGEEHGEEGKGEEDTPRASAGDAQHPLSTTLASWLEEKDPKDRQHLLDCNGVDVKQNPDTVQEMECFFTTFLAVRDVTSVFTQLTTLKILIAPQLTHIRGIEACPNLTELWICEGNVEDISPLATLTKLEKLYMYSNVIASLVPLGGCQELAHIDVEHNHISDISVLAQLPKLSFINAAHNALTQLPSSFATTTALHSLNIAGNNIADFSVSPIPYSSVGVDVDVDALLALRAVKSLRRLWLQGEDYNQNPVCRLSNYHAWIAFLLPSLELLDDFKPPPPKARDSLSLALDAKVVHTFALRHSLLAAAWLWAHDYMKSIYTMRNHFIKDIQVRMAAVKAAFEKNGEDTALQAYIDHLKAQGTQNDQFFEEKTGALPTSHDLYRWRRSMVESFLRLVDTGYIAIHDSQLHPVDISVVGQPAPHPRGNTKPWSAAAQRDVRSFFDAAKFKSYGVVACRVHHVLQVENTHLMDEHKNAIKKFMMRAQEEEQFGSVYYNDNDNANATTTTAANLPSHARRGRISFGDVTTKQGRNGKTTTTVGTLSAVSPSLARELLESDAAYEYLLLDVGGADAVEVDAAITHMCSNPSGGTVPYCLTNRLHTMKHVTQHLSADHSWPPSHFTRVLVVRAYVPGVMWANAREGTMTCKQALETARRRRPKLEPEQQQQQQQWDRKSSGLTSGRGKTSLASSVATLQSRAPTRAATSSSSSSVTSGRRRVGGYGPRSKRPPRRPRRVTECTGEDEADAADADGDDDDDDDDDDDGDDDDDEDDDENGGDGDKQTTAGADVSQGDCSGGGGGDGDGSKASEQGGRGSSSSNKGDKSGRSCADAADARTSVDSIGPMNDDEDEEGAEVHYIVPKGADMWFVPMYVMDVELCKNSLKLKPPSTSAPSTSSSSSSSENAQSGTSKPAMHVPDAVHSEWSRRKKLAGAIAGALSSSILPTLDADTRVFGGIDFASVTRVCLSGLALQSVTELKALPNLKHLNVGYNYLTSLAWIDSLPTLESLDVHHNRISSTDMTAAPRLRFLDLGANSITRALALTTLPAACPALQCMFLNDNPLLESDAVGVLHKLASKFADMRLITLEWSVVYRSSALHETPLPPTLNVRVSPFFQGERRHMCAVWTAPSTAANATSLLSTAAATTGDTTTAPQPPPCIHGTTSVSYSGAQPWEAYRTCQELLLCAESNDAGVLHHVAPQGVTALRRASCMNDAGFSNLGAYAHSVAVPEVVKGVLVRTAATSTQHVVQDGVADFARERGFAQVEWIALHTCRVSTFKLPRSWHDTLTSLSLVDNALSSLKFVRSLPSLRFLDVGHNEIQALDDVATLPHLSTLMLSFNFVHDLRPLRDMLSLTTLYIDHNCISNPREIFHLRELEALRVLNVAANAFCRKRKVVPFVLYYLSGRLTMLNDRLVTKSDLDLARRLFDGVLTIDMIADNVGEDQCEFVRTLDLPHCALREARLSDEMRFEHLYSLNLEDNNMTTLEPLAGLKFLRVLCLNSNRIRKFAANHRPRSADPHATTPAMALPAGNSSTRSGRGSGGSGSSSGGNGSRKERTSALRGQLLSRSTSSIPNSTSSGSSASTTAAAGGGRRTGSPSTARRLALASSRDDVTGPAAKYSSNGASSSGGGGGVLTRGRGVSSTDGARCSSPLGRSAGASRGVRTPPPARRTQSPLPNRARGGALRHRGNSVAGAASSSSSSSTAAASAAASSATSLRRGMWVNSQRPAGSHTLERSSRSTSVVEDAASADPVFPSLEVLMLANNGIHKLEPLQLHRMPKLHTLFLQSNDISSTVGISNLAALNALILDHNRIKTIAKDTLSTCPKLRDLHMNANRLLEVDNLSGNPHLQRVYLQSNRFSALEDLSGLRQSKRLKELVVAENPFARRRDSRLEIIHYLPQQKKAVVQASSKPK